VNFKAQELNFKKLFYKPMLLLAQSVSILNKFTDVLLLSLSYHTPKMPSIIKQDDYFTQNTEKIITNEER
jgi:hypothetical protein